MARYFSTQIGVVEFFSREFVEYSLVKFKINLVMLLPTLK